MTLIRIQRNIQVNSVPVVSETDEIAPEAYDEVNVTVPAGTTRMDPTMVAVQPSEGSSLAFLLIKSSLLDSAISYAMSSVGPWVILDKIHSFVGKGMLSYLGSTPNTFYFSNTTDQDANISIYVGRDATPGDDTPPETPPSEPSTDDNSDVEN